MLITTSFDLLGYDVVAVPGEVFGLTVRCRNIGTRYLARMRPAGRGEIPGVTKLAPATVTQPPVASNERQP